MDYMHIGKNNGHRARMMLGQEHKNTVKTQAMLREQSKHKYQPEDTYLKTDSRSSMASWLSTSGIVRASCYSRHCFFKRERALALICLRRLNGYAQSSNGTPQWT